VPPIHYAFVVNIHDRGDNHNERESFLCLVTEMNMGSLPSIIKHILILIGIVFFFYAAYEGVVGEGGSTSVFTGVGALLIVLAGSYAIDKLLQNY
jgi:hypothetical protein